MNLYPSLISTVPMVKRNTVLIILNGLIDAGCSSERLLHHWLRTGASSKVRVPADWSEMCRTGSKVMVRDRADRWGTVSTNGSSHLIVDVSIPGARVERRCTRQWAMLACETSVFSVYVRLPVDGLHATLEIGGGSELPLANDGPSNYRGPNRRGNDDENCHSGG
jgi:hypothetical protein